MTSSRRRDLWRARACGAVLVALLGACDARAASHPAAPALAGTVVSSARGAVEHVARRDGSYGVYGDYSIYLPAGYGQDPRRRYPVVYLLHGGSDTGSFFLELGVRKAMDDGVRSGAIRPLILVLADGGPTFTGDGTVSVSFDSYLVADLMPDVDHRWRTVPGRAGRAIGGISLGGRHALEFAADHPSLVAAVGGHSTSIPRSPERLAAAGMPIYLDVGTADGLFARDAALADALRRLGADVRWHPAPGEHGRAYWSAHLADYLRFYSEVLGESSAAARLGAPTLSRSTTRSSASGSHAGPDGHSTDPPTSGTTVSPSASRPRRRSSRGRSAGARRTGERL